MNGHFLARRPAGPCRAWALACLLAVGAAGAARAADDGQGAVAQAPPPAVGASAPATGGVRPARGSAEDCRQRRQAYDSSQACFAPYRNAGGGIKPEAFAACGPEVLDPSGDCGPPRN
ncbi:MULTISPECIES: hypothetical protein [Ramlibacter]|uniref:Uncharacterized protein n=1 Tax=Ramlibacter pinisoli TaxID=2682844 RepID=A0A6N8IWI5_9BURK|nr:MULTISPECIES: hypothetical protein [Ramlibacter]MBA2961390.1 hypothetical protein [Ramlibacter sp. CGMCC 1.13660]MVQ31334.1 hypothetical protein [Ramlibacter pinisoli]